MFTHDSLTKACIDFGLDPNKIGKNSQGKKNRRIGAFPDPFDLKTINFPEEELIEVREIGIIIQNLISQSKDTFYSRKGEEDPTTELIDQLLPIIEGALIFWFEKGIKKCKTNKKFVPFNGKIYELDEEHRKSLDEFNNAMEDIYASSIRRSKNYLDILV